MTRARHRGSMHGVGLVQLVAATVLIIVGDLGRGTVAGGCKSCAMRRCVSFTAYIFVCIVAMASLERYYNPTRDHRYFFSLQPRRTSLKLALWSQPEVARWMPCSWWWGTLRRPPENYTNGYIIISCAGGLNQMRRDFCKGVGIARLLNATLLLPRFEASPYWNDTSGFAELFDVDYFLEKVRGWVNVLRVLPVPMEPVPITCHKGSSPFDYTKILLPQLLQHKVILLRPSATQRSDDSPNHNTARKTRCQVCYRSLRLMRSLQEMADKILNALPLPFVALHLRFEPDMIAYSRCRYKNVTMAAVERVRGVRQQVLGDEAEKAWRRKGKCPLTPQETGFILQALRIPASTPIYLAAGSEVHELHELTATYSRVLQKSALLHADQLRALKGSSRAAIDWYVSLHANVYIATFVGNMDKMVVTDRILAGQHRNLVLDRQAFAESKWQGKNEAETSELMLKLHMQHVAYGSNLPVSDCLCKA